MISKQVFWEAIKEPLRLLVLAVIPLAISYFSELNFSWVVPAVFILRFIDKYLHELGKSQSTTRKTSRLVTGLTRF